jgi:hypothetical protein
MYRIPLLDSILLVDCTWNSYDPDRFEIYSMEWEIGITIPKCVWWNLEIDTPERYRWGHGHRTYIHEYIFAWMCEHEPMETYQDYN